MKPKPRILSIKSTLSAENSSSLEAENHFTPSPRPRSLLRKHTLRQEKDGLGEEKETALQKELEAHPAPSSLLGPNDRQREAEEKASPESLDPEVSTPAELMSCVLKFRPWHLIIRDAVFLCTCVCVSVCVTCFLQQLIRK